jgi:hypothetical protein
MSKSFHPETPTAKDGAAKVTVALLGRGHVIISVDRDHSSLATFASCGSFDLVLDRVRGGSELKPGIDSTRRLMTVLFYAITRVIALTNSY